ncbi:MAG: glycosyltransferase [Sulfuriferula sp.]
MKILLVAKPWKGGLAKYLFQALNDVFPHQVQWLPTYPDSVSEHLRYRHDKSAWLDQLITTINQADYEVAIFINHLSIFKKLRTDRRNILWMTDAPSIKPGEDTAFERIFISDLGYEQALLANINETRYHGELAFGCYPKLHQPAQLTQETSHDICFIGNKDPLRDNWLQYFLSRKIDIGVYGNYFLRTSLFWQHPMRFHAGISNEQMQAIYAKYKISMNIHAKVVKQGTNMRTFECAAYQIPQVIDARPGLFRFFDEDTLMVSEHPAQMLAHIHTLLKNPELAHKMAMTARQTVLGKHTYYHRLLQALQGWLTPDAEHRLQQASSVFIK